MAYADYTKPFQLHTDTSESGLGAVLYQKQTNGTEGVIAYASRTLSRSEQNYDAHKLEFLALKWSITDRFHEYLYGRHFEVYTDNNPLTYVLTTAKLDATGQRWIASLANYNFKIFYRSGKLNVEADALLHLPWGSAQMERVEPLVAKMMLQSKIEPGTDLSEEYPPKEILLKGMAMDTMPILNPKDWIKEQMGDADIHKIIQLLKCNQLSTYKVQEIDSSAVRVLLKYRKDLVLKNGLLYRKANLKNHQELVIQFVLPKKFVHKVILACHDDNGHLGKQQTLGLLQRKVFLAQNGCRCTNSYSYL